MARCKKGRHELPIADILHFARCESPRAPFGATARSSPHNVLGSLPVADTHPL